MDIRITHTLTLSDEAKDFLSELFGKKSVDTAFPVIPSSPREGMSAGAAVDTLLVAGLDTARKKVVPPGISCTRIGQDTAAEIMKLLPANIETIEKSIKRKRFDAEALLKLLWERNKLGYDGEVYHELT